MTPTANNTDVYVPSVNCLPGDDAADVVTPLVCAAVFAPDEVPAVLLAVEPALLVLVLVLVLDFFTTLVAKPGDESVFSSVCSIVASGPKKTKKLTNPRLVDIEDGIYILQVNGPKKPCAGHNFAAEDVARADTAAGRV